MAAGLEISEALAGMLEEAMEEHAGAHAVPCRAGVAGWQEGMSHVFVRATSFEEVVPDTCFYRVVGNATVRLLGSGATPAELREQRHVLLAVLGECFEREFGRGSCGLDDWGCPATVRSFYSEYMPLEVDGDFYTAGLEFRAYVQF